MISNPFPFWTTLTLTSRRLGSQLYELALPEDDPDALELLSNILHHRDDVTPSKPSLTELKALSVLCHKYDCLNNMIRNYPTAILNSCIPKREPTTTSVPKSNLELLAISYLFDNAQVFNAVTKSFILESNDTILFLVKLSNEDGILPFELFCKIPFSMPFSFLQNSSGTLLIMKLDALNQARELAQGVIEMFVYYRYPFGQFNEDLETFCDKCKNSFTQDYWYSTSMSINDEHGDTFCATVLPLAYQQELHAIGFIEALRNKDSIASLINAISKYDHKRMLERGNVQCSANMDHPTWYSDVQHEIEALLDEVNEVCTGICLDCFKAGQKRKRECRVPHK
jgi:hypothetical protein